MDPYAAAGYGQPNPFGPSPYGPNPYGAYAGPTGQSMALVPVGMNPMLMGGGAIVPYGMGPFGGMPVAAGGLAAGSRGGTGVAGGSLVGCAAGGSLLALPSVLFDALWCAVCNRDCCKRLTTQEP